MLLNRCCSFNIFSDKKSVGGDAKKSITSSFFNRITFHLAVGCRTFRQINVESLKLKFQTVAEKTAKNFRGLLYFAAPGTFIIHTTSTTSAVQLPDAFRAPEIIRKTFSQQKNGTALT